MGLFDGDDGDTQTGGFEDEATIGPGGAVRVIDEEAGVVLYGMKVQRGDAEAKGGGFGLTAIPLEQTDLDVEDGSE